MRCLLGAGLPAERGVVRNCAQEGRPNPRHAVQSCQVAEWATGLPIGNNAFRQPRPDSRQPGHFCRPRPVKIDTLPGLQRPAEGDGAVLVGQGRLARQRLDQLDLAGGLTGAAGDEPSGVAGDGESQQEDESAALGGRHAGNGGAAGDR